MASDLIRSWISPAILAWAPTSCRVDRFDARADLALQIARGKRFEVGPGRHRKTRRDRRAGRDQRGEAGTFSTDERNVAV